MTGELIAPPAAPDKEKHDFLVGVLKDARSGLIDYMFKQGAVLTLVSGWILSSKDAQKFIGCNRPVQIVIASIIVIYAVLFPMWTLSWRRRSIFAFQQLVELRYMPKEFYSSLRINIPLIAGFIFIHISICAGLVFEIWSMLAIQLRFRTKAHCLPRIFVRPFFHSLSNPMRRAEDSTRLIFLQLVP